MPRKTAAAATSGHQPESYSHKAATRRNAPTVETAPILPDKDRRPVTIKLDRREQVTPLLAWDRQGETSDRGETLAQTDQIETTGSPLYVREKIDARTLVAQITRRASSPEQVDMFADFNGLPTDADTFQAYAYDGHWQNRLIHGESSEVMKSLIVKDRLAGRVQMIYYDPPYGMGYKSNFQPTINNLDVKDKSESIPSGDALPIQAFRDSYRNGIDSYLDQIHQTAYLGRELLAETGSFFLQIGDDNVHRCAVILDEIFGAENRVATITYRPAGSSSATMLPEVSSFLLWYAKDKGQAKYQQIYRKGTRQMTMDYFGGFAFVELPDGSIRKPTQQERRDVRVLPSKARILRHMPLQSNGYDQHNSQEYWFEGRWRATGATRHWRISTHAPKCSNGTLVTPEDQSPCPGDPHGHRLTCGMCSLKKQNRLIVPGEKSQALSWKKYEEEWPGPEYNNLWASVEQARPKRYVVQTAASLVEHCMLMTTDPGDLVLDPTCGSGTTAEVAETWGRRWVTCDVQRVSVEVARKHLMTRPYPWHRVVGDGDDPAAGFVVETMPHVSAATLAYGTLHEPENQIALVDRTDVDSRRLRVCSPFTVESSSPFSYLSSEEDSAVPVRRPPSETQTATVLSVLESLSAAPVCDNESRALFRVLSTRTPAWAVDAAVMDRTAECAPVNGGPVFTAGLVVAPADVLVTAGLARRAALDVSTHEPGCEHLLLVGYAFEPKIPHHIADLEVHRISADRSLMIPETAKKGKTEASTSGAFTLLADLDCSLIRHDDGRVSVELNGWDSYDPATGEVRQGEPGDIDCWLIDTDHDGESFFGRLIYFPNGAGAPQFAKLVKSLAKAGALDPNAEDSLYSLTSQPFDPPRPGNTIAVKAITDTAAEITGAIHSGWGSTVSGGPA